MISWSIFFLVGRLPRINVGVGGCIVRHSSDDSVIAVVIPESISAVLYHVWVHGIRGVCGLEEVCGMLYWYVHMFVRTYVCVCLTILHMNKCTMYMCIYVCT